ncbi:MAG: biotin--[acetyl-CoA-carboxylase] ligase [Blastocatellia bacterium]
MSSVNHDTPESFPDDSGFRIPQSAFHIPHSLFPFTIHHFATLGSTNDHLKQLREAPEFTVITADSQTAGRGRRDRAWHSAPGSGLYMSVLLRPRVEGEKLALVGLLCAVAVAETLLDHTRDISIKWPNDVLLREKKICGILIDGTSGSAELPRLIAGIGVNLNHEAFPPELRETATSLYLESGGRVGAPEFRDQLLARLAVWYERLHSDHRAILRRWTALSPYAENMPVTVTLDQEQITGITCGVTDTGALRVRMDNGHVRVILAGEITRLRRTNAPTPDASKQNVR